MPFRYVSRHIKAIQISETRLLRFTCEATARFRRSLTSRQHFEVDGGGIKCSLGSKKIRSHFVIVSVSVKLVPDKRIMCMCLQSPSRARLRRRSFSLSDEINDQTICLSQKIPKPWFSKSSAWGTVPPGPGFFDPKWPLGVPRGGGTSNPGLFGLDGAPGGHFACFGFSSFYLYLGLNPGWRL